MTDTKKAKRHDWSAAREVLAGVGIGAVGCGAWLLGMVAVAHPEEAKVALTRVGVVVCCAVISIGLSGEGRRWR